MRHLYFAGLYVKALANGVDEILSAYRQTLLRIEEEVFVAYTLAVVV